MRAVVSILARQLAVKPSLSLLFRATANLRMFVTQDAFVDVLER